MNKEKIAKMLKFTGLGKDEVLNLIEVPKNSDLGDYAFPFFSLAGRFKKNPALIAADIVKKIKKTEDFEKIEAVGGYVNFFVNKKKFAEETIKNVDAYGKRYGSGKNKGKVMIEFSQPNTHKAFHIGHIRGTSLGESMARILEFSGHEVVRANYSGDTGMHIAKWMWGYLKYHSHENLKDDEEWIAEIYTDAVKKIGKDEKIQEEVNKINRKLDSKSDDKLNKLWEKTRELSIRSWAKIYDELNTKFDVHYFESEFEKDGKKISRELLNKKIAEVSDDATIVRLDKYGLGVWVLLRKDGTVLYSAKDLALAYKKFKDFKIKRCITITAAEQNLHFKQLQKTLELVKFKNWKDYDHFGYGEIRLPWGKMSSRTGDNVLYSEFKTEIVRLAAKEVEARFPKLEEIKIYDRALAIFIAALKYSMLKQDINKTIIFDPKKSISFEGDTGPYLLYSYARAKSILGKAEYKKQKKFDVVEINEYERNLINELARFPEVVRSAYENLAPNAIANYSFELAQMFNEFYHNCPVIGSDEEDFRLKLVDCFSQVLKNGLHLLGIGVIEEM